MKYRSIVLDRLEGADGSNNINKTDLAWIKTELESLGFVVEAKTVKRMDLNGLQKMNKEDILKKILELSEVKETKNISKEAVIPS